jgi:hypothetical protein
VVDTGNADYTAVQIQISEQSDSSLANPNAPTPDAIATEIGNLVKNSSSPWYDTRNQHLSGATDPGFLQVGPPKKKSNAFDPLLIVYIVIGVLVLVVVGVIIYRVYKWKLDQRGNPWERQMQDAEKNKPTKTAQREFQVAMASVPGQPPTTSPTVVAPAAATSDLTDAASSPALPPGWTQRYDQASGQYYYYNTASGQSQWELPQ